MKNLKYFLFLLVILFVISGCSARNQVAVIWTNSVDFISYAEKFNSSQNEWKVVVKYKESPSQALVLEQEKPDIVISPWLKSRETRSYFTTLDYLFSELDLDRSIFYKELLELGKIQGFQYLLPVNFNLPAVIFKNDGNNFSQSKFILSLDEIKKTSKEYNVKKGDVYTRMGFVPSAYPEFMYLTTVLFGSGYEEGGKLFSWNQENLDKGISYIKDWITEANTSFTAEQDFVFKYFYNPAYNLVMDGRILLAYTTSRELFTYSLGKLSNLDYRWITLNGEVPVLEDMLYLGICKEGKNRRAARAFVTWFFNEETQKNLLENSKNLSLMNTSFGIAGGFSSIKNINDKVLPGFYPVLLGHLSQLENIIVPNVLPSNWVTLKTRIILPFIKDKIISEETDKIIPMETRIDIWLREN